MYLELTFLRHQKAFSVDEALTMQEMEIGKLQSALDEIHKEVGEMLDSIRKKAIECYNYKTHVKS